MADIFRYQAIGEMGSSCGDWIILLEDIKYILENTTGSCLSNATPAIEIWSILKPYKTQGKMRIASLSSGEVKITPLSTQVIVIKKR